MPLNIVVVGAGVIGLTCALELSQQGHSVTIVTKDIPSDFSFSALTYTSPFAGANWESFAKDDEIEVQEIDLVGYLKFKELLKIKESGIVSRKNKVFTSVEKFELKDDGKVITPWFKGVEPANLKMCTDEELSGHNALGKEFAYGYEFDGFVISTTYYLNYLLNECFRSGVTLKRKTLTSVAQADKYHYSGARPDLIINCTGLSARKLCDDENVYPVRGCTIVVENHVDDLYVVELFEKEFPEEVFYCMPRKEGGCIIGGCFEPNGDANIDPIQVERILSRAERYVPDLLNPKVHNNSTKFDIVRYQVGLRPARKEGFRIELDQNLLNNKDEINVVHCYGHGGSGYQSSWGSAAKVVGIVNEYINTYK